jgi:serine/threonine-protein kinase
MVIDYGDQDSLERLRRRIQNPLPARVVFLLHGIRTAGRWQKLASAELSRAGFVVVPLDYGYFLASQLVRRSARETKVRWLLDEYSNWRRIVGCNRPSIIAHSLGTYLVASALEKYAQVKFDRIILCGAIVRTNFPWKLLIERGQVRSVLNQHGGNDFWANVVQWFVNDAGPSGVRGFDERSTAQLIQRSNPSFKHSDYFYSANFSDTWFHFCGAKIQDYHRLNHNWFSTGDLRLRCSC